MENNVHLELKSDGIYLNIVCPKGNPRPSRMDVLRLLEDSGVQNIDFVAINELFKSEEELVSKKISSDKEINKTPETMEISIASSGTEASVIFNRPSFGGEKLTAQQIKRLLEESNVRYGVLNDVIESLVESKEYLKPYVLAKGFEPVQGKDGYLTFHIDFEKSHKPKELDNGKVDYHNLNMFTMVNKDDILVSYVDEVAGTDGMDVRGIPILAKKVKKAPALPRGKNTRISSDEHNLISDINGQVVLDGKRVSVHPILQIDGDVDNNTGDVHFNGGVFVKGNVLTGFTIIADGAIEVKGVVEGATLRSGENITISGGVQGLDKAIIEASGNIYLKYAEQCNLSAGKNIYADNIMHSQVRCSGDLELNGKSGLLVGGKTIVGGNAKSVNIGSKMATLTEIEAGFDPKDLIMYKDAMNEYNVNKAEYEKMTLIVKSLNDQNIAHGLNEDKKRMLLKSIHSRIYLRDRMLKSQNDVKELALMLSEKRGAVMASGVIRSGVKVTIGNAMLFIRDDLINCSLTNENAKIHIGPYI